MVLGAIELDTLPESDHELRENARLVDLPSSRNSLSQASVFDMVEQAGMQQAIVANTLTTMIKAGQIEYLRKGGLVNEDWMVLIEVHYYRSRDQASSQFHKDTLGKTLFVNLDYDNEDPIAGPEYLLQPPTVQAHEDQIAETLTPEFLSDCARSATTRRSPRRSRRRSRRVRCRRVRRRDGSPMTPLRGHREVAARDFGRYLQNKYTGRTRTGRSRRRRCSRSGAR